MIRSDTNPSSEETDVVLRVKDVSKSYLVWKDPAARLKVPLMHMISRSFPLLKSAIDLRIHDLCSDFKALRNISFDLPRGTSMAVIGRNGSGKSTLLQMIAGTLQPTTGEVECHGRIAALLELGSSFNPEFTGRDNVYMNGAIYGLDADEISSRMHEVEEFAEIGSHIDQPVKTYSSGMMMRLAFSVQVLMDPEILIVDEALSVGDIFFQQKCFDRMRYLTESGTSILFVSHDLVTVSQFTQTAMVLQGGECVFLGDSGVAVKEFQIMERASNYRPSTLVNNSPQPRHIQSLASAPHQTIKESFDSSLASHFVERSTLAEIDLSEIIQIGKENAEFIKLSLFDSSGYPATVFTQGSRLFVECEVLVHSKFECLSVGVSIKDRTNTFVHGKHSIQHGVRPRPLNSGDVVGLQFSFDLELALGQYTLDIGIIDIDQSVDGGIPVELMEASITRVCLNDGFASFQIGPRSQYRYFQLPFYGVAELAGDCLRFS